MRRRRIALLGLGVAAGTLAAVVVTTAGTSSASVSVSQATDLVRSATVISQQVVVPASSGESDDLHPATTDLTKTESLGRERLSAYYTGKALVDQTADLDKAMHQEEQPDFVALGGGASDFVVTSTRSSGSALYVKARVDVWSLVGQIQRGKVVRARPVNTILVTATVVKTASGPRISSYIWTFAPGSSP